ncbi:MAG: fumarylacetoacetate hydrolase family protein [Rubrivivax sp.]
MRFVTFEVSDGKSGTGVLTDAGDPVVDLSHLACARLLGGCAPSLLAMIGRGFDGFVQRIGAAALDPAASRPMSWLRLSAPLCPGTIIGAAVHFTDALHRRQMPHPPEPVTFFRLGWTAVGPDGPVLIPPGVTNLTDEAELALVIGRRCLHVPAADAMRCVAGYVAHNGVSTVDLIKTAENFVRGKNLPSSAPLGPWLLSAGAMPDPHAVDFRLSIDGRALQDGSTATLTQRIPERIEHISVRMPLDPGDGRSRRAGAAARPDRSRGALPGGLIEPRGAGGAHSFKGEKRCSVT